MPARTPRNHQRRSTCIIDALEPRRLLCANGRSLDHGVVHPIVEELSNFSSSRVGSSSSLSASESTAASIVWVNRGVTTGTNNDRFNDIFGASAEAARRVVDQALIDAARMVGSFNYATPASYNLTLSMGSAGSGFGAVAFLNGLLGGKPRTGSITLQGGNSNSADPFKGWFVDPTPDDDSEFLGTIQHAFTGSAQSGSPASGKPDFYTVVTHEVMHTLGLTGGLNAWSSRTTDTGIADNAEGGGVGRFFHFQGPSISHLLSSNNGGPGGQDANAAVHSAGFISRTFNGTTYVGQNDIGNAVYEFGVRYKPNLAFSLMFKDAYGYSGANPAQHGSFYAALDRTTGLLTVRGSNTSNFTNAIESADAISVRVLGSELLVSVDIGTDPGGTGALPGLGNLPAWEHRFNLNDVSSVLIQSGAGNDTITVGPDVPVQVIVDAGGGTDALIFEARAGGSDFVFTPGTFAGSAQGTWAGTESISIIGGAGNDSLAISAGVTLPVNVAGNGGFDQITYNGSNSVDAVVLNNLTLTAAVNLSHSGIERFVLNTLASADTFDISGAVVAVIRTGTGNDLITVNAGARVIFDSPEPNIASLNLNPGASAEILAGGSNTMKLGTLSVDGTFDLNDNPLIVSSTPFATIRSLIANGYNADGWNGTAPAITSSVAASSTINDGLGHASAGNIGVNTFGGLPVSGSDTTVFLILAGDNNLDRSVNFNDLLSLVRNYNRSGIWSSGDFNFDNTVGFEDLVLLTRNYNLTLSVSPLVLTGNSRKSDRTSGARDVLV